MKTLRLTSDDRFIITGIFEDDKSVDIAQIVKNVKVFTALKLDSLPEFTKDSKPPVDDPVDYDIDDDPWTYLFERFKDSQRWYGSVKAAFRIAKAWDAVSTPSKKEEKASK